MSKLDEIQNDELENVTGGCGSKEGRGKQHILRDTESSKQHNLRDTE